MKKLFLIHALFFGAIISAHAEFSHAWGSHGGWGAPGYMPYHRAWGPGFWGSRPIPLPVGPFMPFVPYPGWVPGPGIPSGYVFNCFAQNGYGQPFYATGVDPNFAMTQAMQYCSTSGLPCAPVRCQ
jgi:hypothetical protein